MRRRRKLEFLAFLLPIGGAILILPPLVLIANASTSIFGFPAIVAYLFAVWLTLIVATYLLQHKLGSLQDVDAETQPAPPGSGKLK